MLLDRVLLWLLTLSVLAGTLAAKGQQGIPLLQVGKPVERDLAGGQAHSYSVALASGQYIHVVVEQRGIDVVVRLFGPAGNQLAETDSLNGTQGPESVFFSATQTGAHRLEVRPLNNEVATGRYEVRIEESRTARDTDKERIQAEALFNEATLLRNAGTAESLDRALRKFEEALPLFRALNDTLRRVMALNSMGFAYASSGEKAKALNSFTQALSLARPVRDRSGEGVALSGLGLVHNVTEKQKALESYTQAIPLFHSVGDRSNEAVALASIGLVYLRLGDIRKALESYTQALPLARGVGDRGSEAKSLAGLGYVHLRTRETHKAVDSFTRALSVARSVGDRQNEAEALGILGYSYGTLGEIQKAVESFILALPLFESLGDRAGQGATLMQFGFVYLRSGERQKAIETLTKALALAREVGDRDTEAQALNGLAINGLDRTTSALDQLKESLRLARETGNRGGEADTLNNIGLAHILSEEPEMALDSFTLALDVYRALNDHQGAATALVNRAFVERIDDELIQSRADIEEALAIFESLRKKVANQEFRTSYFATVQDHYKFYIDLLMELHEEDPSKGHDGEALQASERARARALLDTLAEARADIRQGVDSRLVERERALRQRLNAKAEEQMKLLSGPHAEERAKVLAQEIEGLTSEFQQVETEIRQTSPRYAALTQPQPLTLKEIQTKVLDNNTLLLEYSLGAESSYLWAVTQDSITSYELPKRAAIEEVSRQVYAALTNPSQWTDSRSYGQRSTERVDAGARVSTSESATRLSQMVLAPVMAQLGKKRLVIVADGTLQFIPFGALPIPGAPSEKVPYRPLIVEHEVVSLPSASALAVLRRKVKDRQLAAKAIVVLGDPVFEGNDERIKSSIRKARGRGATPEADGRAVQSVLERSAQESGIKATVLGLPRLPGTRSEAEQIVSLVSPASRELALDFAASRDTATGRDLSQYRFVHFATHGFLNSQHPELSGIVLSLFDEQGNPQEGFLRLHDVFNLKLSADMVVLSACQTGLGKEVRGEGLIGLTRGFMYAGALRVVVSLWSVNDQATAELMTRFYKGILVNKLRPVQALQAAQVSMFQEKRYSAPYYWAAFTLQGEWR